ncbi:MAG: hypothetical protein COC19_06940 [SAR86 cluster bacterium]|uniref:Uncharacterized protein n=1 Tax=SAR86 cluster bacterium TaxID=2030880 RepID=A0A2A4MIV9_9GAMM|nr:MAG: hypothetical protein COC19_06940 [SAR86 cluster bacterium]
MYTKANLRSISNAHIFNRAELQFTVQLLRSYNPSLALQIQNILAAKHFESDSTSQVCDSYVLNLDSYTLKRVVETVGTAGHDLAQQVLQTNEGDYDKLLLTKQIVSKWLDYAKQYMSTQERMHWADA